MLKRSNGFVEFSIYDYVLSCSNSCSASASIGTINLPSSVIQLLPNSGITTLNQLVGTISSNVGAENAIKYIKIGYYLSLDGSVGSNNCNYDLYAQTNYSDNVPFTTYLASTGTDKASISTPWTGTRTNTTAMLTSVSTYESQPQCMFDSNGDWNVSVDLMIEVNINIDGLCSGNYLNENVCSNLQSKVRTYDQFFTPQQNLQNSPPRIQNLPPRIPPSTETFNNLLSSPHPLNPKYSNDFTVNEVEPNNLHDWRSQKWLPPGFGLPGNSEIPGPTSDLQLTNTTSYWWIILILVLIVVFIVFIININKFVK
jgi:hypothetical protein